MTFENDSDVIPQAFNQHFGMATRFRVALSDLLSNVGETAVHLGETTIHLGETAIHLRESGAHLAAQFRDRPAQSLCR